MSCRRLAYRIFFRQAAEAKKLFLSVKGGPKAKGFRAACAIVSKCNVGAELSAPRHLKNKMMIGLKYNVGAVSSAQTHIKK